MHIYTESHSCPAIGDLQSPMNILISVPLCELCDKPEFHGSFCLDNGLQPIAFAMLTSPSRFFSIPLWRACPASVGRAGCGICLVLKYVDTISLGE